MKQSPGTSNHYFFLSPYLFSLTCFGLIGILALAAISCYFICATGSDLRSIIFVMLPVIVYLAVGVRNAHEFWGIVCVTDQKLIVMAPFRKPISFPYEDIADIGIDYGTLIVRDQFWIYIGKSTVPPQYCHRINRLPVNGEYIRIQYSSRVFSALRNKLPNRMKKRLENSQTILRAR